MQSKSLNLVVISVFLSISFWGTVPATVTITEDQLNGYEFTEQAGEPDYELVLDNEDENGYFDFGGNQFKVNPGVSINFGGETILVMTDETYINDPDHGGSANDRATLSVIGRIEIHSEEFKMSYTDLSKWGGVEPLLVVRFVERYEISNCNFSNEGSEEFTIVLAEEEGVSSQGTVQNCNIITPDPGNYGIMILGNDEGPTCEISGCNISVNGVGIFIEDIVFQGEDENSIPVQIFNNMIHNADVERDAIGIWLRDTIQPNSVMIRNNVIYDCSSGISTQTVFNNESKRTPYIYNNAVFNCDVGLHVSNIQEGENSERIRIRNNIVWNCGTPGVSCWFEDGATIEDIEFVNNMLGSNNVGISLNNNEGDFEPGIGSIGYTAFKNNTISDVWYGEWGDDPEVLAESCVMFESSETFALVNESPDDDNWDFHPIIENIEIDPVLNLNMAIVNSGNDFEGDWLDANSHGLHDNATDMGIYGGPYSLGNIDNSFDIQDDYNLLTDIYFLTLAYTPADYYKWQFDDPPQFFPANGDTYMVGSGNAMDFGDLVANVAGDFQVNGDSNNPVYLIFDGGYLNFTTNVDPSSSFLNYCNISGASYGLYLTGVDDYYGNRLQVSNCTFDSCGVGVYANNSRLALTNCTITGSNDLTYGGAGVYLSNCGSGKVIIDGCTISGNGTESTVASPGIYLSSSSPEIINTLIEDNSGAGIVCYGSTPDLDTYDYLLMTDQPNTIQSNGGATQSGSDGAEIYLTTSSYPTIKYNNIVDYSSGPIGYMIYKDQTYNSLPLTATYNWWGNSAPTSSYFYWGSGSAIDYSYAQMAELSSAERFDLAMGLWDEGDFAGCAEILEDCVYDTGVVGIKSVHYLSGCVGETPQERQAGRLSYAGLREFLQEVAGEHSDGRVARVASRFATDCLTQIWDYEGAMGEYDDVRANADCLEDSVMAEIDWLAVFELANGHEINASGKSVQAQMREAFDALNRGRNDKSGFVPGEFAIEAAYPNPFNSITRIAFGLPEASQVSIRVYDLSGREAATLVNSYLQAGHYNVEWNGGTSAAGVYLVEMEAGGFSETRKLLLVK